MIKFFRNIRLKLLSENRVSRYILYALGEILLVILGILLALQINTWNENRKLANREAFVLDKLLKEYQADSTILDRFILLTKMKADRGKSIRNIINGEEVLDTNFLITHAFLNGRVLIFEGYTPTYDELIASGNLSIIQNRELVDKIKVFRNNLKIDNTFMNGEALRRKEAYNNHLYRYFDGETMTYLWQNIGDVKSKEFEKYDSDIKGFMADTETLYYLNIQIGTDAEMHWIYKERRMVQMTEILNLIRSEIANNIY